MSDRRPLVSCDKNRIKHQKRYLYGFTGTFALVMFVALTHFSTTDATDGTDVSRDPAAVKDSFAKKKPEHGFLKHTQKIVGPLSARIENISGFQPESGDRFTLKAVVETQKPLQKVDLKWHLPNGVELISGHLHETLLDLEVNKPLAREITLKLNSDKNEKVFLQVRSKDHGTHFSHAAQFNTLEQRKIDQEKEALSNRHQQYLRSVHRRHKVFE